MPTLVIIGAGPAGEAAAKTARRISSARVTAGGAPESPLRIVLIEKEHAGGLCLNHGCVPSKTLLEQTHRLVKTGQKIGWTEIQTVKKNVVQDLRGQLESAFKTLKIERVTGTARFTSPSSVDIRNASETSSITFDRAVIATGTTAVFPPPFDGVRDQVWDSDRALEIDRTPASIAIVGGGAVGCEFACLLHAAGAKVTIIELQNQLLPGEDAGIASALQRSYEQRGIRVLTGVSAKNVGRFGDGWRLELSTGEALETENVLVCVGRRPDPSGLAPEAAGVAVDRRGFVVNDRFQTSNPNIYVAGDAATTRLAHAAAVQGEVAAANALGEDRRYDDRLVPRCLYSWPEVASVGAWKYQREEKNLPVKTSRAFFKGSARALAAGEIDGFVQIVSDPASGKILGGQIIGPQATELIHIFSVALKAEMTLSALAETMFAHPTLGEIVRDAARR